MAKVLIIEDDQSLAKAYRALLAGKGHAVMAAADGEAGLELCRRESPDIVILDLLLPKRSGFDVLASASIEPALRALPFIVLSNVGSEEDKKRALSLGAREYAVKSEISLQDVARLVETHVRRT